MIGVKAILLFVSFVVYAESVIPSKCAAVSCIPSDCPNAYIPPGQCCPVCPQVEKPGSCPRARGRGICVSLCNADPECPLDKKCCSNGCGQVCQSPEGADRSCFHKGTLHKDGQTFKDDCNFCSCRNGRVSCTKMGCNNEKPGKCPSHIGLGRGGICVELCSGDSECPSEEKCCSNGCGHTCQKPDSADCSRVICPACVGFTKPRDCCPTCFSVVS